VIAPVAIERGIKGIRVLLVEDDEDQRILMTMLYEAAGYTVRIASNGEEALVVLDEWTPHVVVSDLMMPVMDGLAMIQKMKSCADLQDIPIMVLTALDNSETEVQLLDMGVNEYLEKTTPRKVMMKRLEKILRDKQML